MLPAFLQTNAIHREKKTVCFSILKGFIFCLFFISNLTSLCGKFSLSIRPLPKTIGINKKLVTKKIQPDTTPIASGLKSQG